MFKELILFWISKHLKKKFEEIKDKVLTDESFGLDWYMKY